jgi:type I site-specific restriction-modification system R (restriction) subunit
MTARWSRKPRVITSSTSAFNHHSGGSHKGGVVWYTQGSGKNITMTCFVARAMLEAAMENPKIVVIFDEAHRTQYGFEAKLKI